MLMMLLLYHYKDPSTTTTPTSEHNTIITLGLLSSSREASNAISVTSIESHSRQTDMLKSVYEQRERRDQRRRQNSMNHPKFTRAVYQRDKAWLLRLLLATLSFFLMFHNPYLVQAAHSRRRRVVTTPNGNAASKYDRSITTFDPQGRLQQLQYSLLATQSKQTKNVLAVLVKDHENSDATGIYLIVERGSLLPGSSLAPPSCRYKVHRLDDDSFMITTGFMGDGALLVQALRQYCQEYKFQNAQAPTVRQLADYCAYNLQHALTYTGGARPLACTVLLLGREGGRGVRRTPKGQEHPSTSEPMNEETLDEDFDGLRIYRCQPGGTVEDCRYCAAGRNQAELLQRLLETEDGEMNPDTSVYEQLVPRSDASEDAKVGPRPSVRSVIAAKLVRLMSQILFSKDTTPSKSKDDNDTPDDTQYVDVWYFRPLFTRDESLESTSDKGDEHLSGSRSSLETTCILSIPIRTRQSVSVDSEDDALALSLNQWL